MNKRLRIAFWCFAVVAGFVQAWAYRFYIEPDGVNYLDIASAYQRHNWVAAINTYWSPLYSWLLAGVFSIVRPSAYWESTLLHALNFLIFLASVRCGEFFIDELTANRDEGLLPSWALWWIGRCLLLFVSLFMCSAYLDTPDLLMSAMLYLAGGLLLRIRAGSASLKSYAFFGVFLGFAYLAKTIMFLVAFAFLFAAGRRRASILSFACFAAISATWIIAMTHAVRRLTYGDSGWTNYVMYVAASGTAVHPPRILFSSPEVREFATPIQATYPPWYDHAYWLAGLRPSLSTTTQLKALKTALRSYLWILSGIKEFLVALFLLLLARPVLPNTRWAIFLPSTIAFCLYALVGHVESRLVGAFFILFWLPIFAGVHVHERRSKVVPCAVMLVVAITAFKVAKASVLAPYSAPHVQWTAMMELRSLHLQPGDQFAVLGHTTIADYWAHMGGFRIVADIPLEEVQCYWRATPEKRAEISSALAARGVQAIVSAAPPQTPDGWQPLRDSGYYVNILPAPRATP